MKIILVIIIYLSLNIYCKGQYPNVLLGDQNAPDEPSIMMDIKNPNNLFVGANINKLYKSFDGGKSWSTHYLQSEYGVWGDPCIIVDTNSHFYFFHLSNPPDGKGNFIDRIVCQRFSKPYNDYDIDTYIGLNGTKVQDKEWACVDRKSNNIYVAWTQFDKYKSSNPLDSSVILFSRSTDEGQSWSSPIRLSEKAGDCMDSDNTAEGAVPVCGPNSEIYISWANGGKIYFDRSLDSGKTWLDKDITVCEQPGSWDISISGIYRANGMPVTCADISNGPYHGTIYINYSAQQFTGSDTDIYLTKSTDNGNTWSEPLRVNDDEPGKQQFLSWMTIDQITGYIYIIFYDRRDYNDNRTDVYLAYSKDGGKSFINKRISESAFTPETSIFFGDYTNITAHNGKVIPVWTRMDNYKKSIYCALINDIATEQNELIEPKKTIKIYPNPSEGYINLRFFAERSFDYNIKIYNHIGNLIYEQDFANQTNRGENDLKFMFPQKYLKNGIYYLTLNNSETSFRKQFIVVE